MENESTAPDKTEIESKILSLLDGLCLADWKGIKQSIDETLEVGFLFNTKERKLD